MSHWQVLTLSRIARRISFLPIASVCTSSVCHTYTKKWVAPTLREMKERVDQLKRKGEYPIIKRSEFLEWNYDAELYAFGKRLHEEFDELLLKEALRDHYYVFNLSKDSSKSDNENELKSNKELSSAGKALIQDFSKKYLRTYWPTLPEEGIKAFSEFLCSESTLTAVAFGIGLKDLVLSKEYPPNEETMSTCLCAVVACLNATSGLDRCHLFIRDFVVTQLCDKDLWDIWKIEEPYSLLQQIFAQSSLSPLEPRVIGELGKNTLESVYNIGIYSDKQFIGSGYGEEPQIGLHVASLNVLSRLFGNTLCRDPLPFNKEFSNNDMKITPNPSLKEYKLSSLQT